MINNSNKLLNYSKNRTVTSKNESLNRKKNKTSKNNKSNSKSKKHSNIQKKSNKKNTGRQVSMRKNKKGKKRYTKNKKKTGGSNLPNKQQSLLIRNTFNIAAKLKLKPNGNENNIALSEESNNNKSKRIFGLAKKKNYTFS